MGQTVFQMPLAVVLFGQEGCPSCEAFVPHFRAAAARHARCVPSMAIDCRRFPQAADHYRISSTPTVLVLRWGQPSGRRVVGDVGAAGAERIFQGAMRGMECSL